MMIMLLKYMFGKVPQYYNSKNMDKFCKKVQIVLNDPEKCLEYFQRIVNLFDSITEVDFTERKVFEKKETTDILLQYKDRLIV